MTVFRAIALSPDHRAIADGGKGLVLYVSPGVGGLWLGVVNRQGRCVKREHVTGNDWRLRVLDWAPAT